ncbi:peptidylprolyl isomerase [Streptomyces sp. 6N223]|uniref:peptidylprolyl isomerase n=1 Tax=Streptomyces sp. 6N223 TaxID=3457412 RepID=UPI003FD3C6FF
MTSKEQRRKELARAKWERQQRRRADRVRRARRRNVIIAAALVVLVAAGTFGLVALLGGDDDSSNQAGDEQGAEPTASDSAEPSTPPEDPCDKPAKGDPAGETWNAEPEMTIDTSAEYVMGLRTTCGDIEITMDAEAAPHTVNSFAFLAGEDYFDHTTCHRLTTEGIFVLQCGDPQGTGSGGPGYTIPDENLDDPDVAGGTYPAGTVAMANQYNAQDGSGRDSGGSQFFLVYKDSPLPPDYTPFGTITAGTDVLQKIADTGSTTDPATGTTVPNATVVINEATVERRDGGS